MIAHTVQQYLHQQGVQYDVITHPARNTSYSKAIASHIPPNQMIKAVLLVDLRDSLALVLIPADRMLSLFHLKRETKRQFRLAIESEIQRVFYDCVPGAIPAFGNAYHLETLIDEKLMHKPQLYFESGDQRQVLQLTQAQFKQLTKDCQRGGYSVMPDLCPQFS